MKTSCALADGFNLIRIDYTQIDSAESHIMKALQSSERLYLSAPSMYTWVLEGINSSSDPAQIQPFISPDAPTQAPSPLTIIKLEIS